MGLGCTDESFGSGFGINVNGNGNDNVVIGAAVSYFSFLGRILILLWRGICEYNDNSEALWSDPNTDHGVNPTWIN